MKLRFAQELRKARIAMGLQRWATAARAGISEQTVIFLEQGQRNPSLESALRLALVTGVDLPGLVAELVQDAAHPDDLSRGMVDTANFLDRRGRGLDFAE